MPKPEYEVRSCRCKIRYTHALAATLAFIRLAANGLDRLTLGTYHCRFCGGWHLGNRRAPNTVRHYQRRKDRMLARLICKSIQSQ